MDKQMIEEMAIMISGSTEMDTMGYYRSVEKAKNIYNAGYRKIPENAVVLTKEEYKTLKDLAMDKCHYDCHLIDYPDFERERMLRDDTRKETAEKFAERLKERSFDEYSPYGRSYECVAVSDIDEICKEITEG